MVDLTTPAEYAGRAADEAGFAGASIGAVRDEIEAGDLGAAAEAVKIAAGAAKLAAEQAAKAARAVDVITGEARAAREDRRLGLPGWQERVALVSGVLGSLGSDSAARGHVLDAIDSAARAAGLAAEAAELLAEALAPSPGCYGCETHRPSGNEHAIDCKHAAPRSSQQ